MRYRVSRLASLVPLLISLAAAGCGEVESGVCAGEQVDEVACTVDICDGEAKAWAHIPDNSLCGAGMRCDPTAGCVASGALTGRALLLGKTDHSGITVTAEGTEASTTTAADGSWTLSGLAPGMYKVTYSKDKYFPTSEPGLAVTVEAAVSAPTVELSHAEDRYPNSDLLSVQGITFSPDKSYMVQLFNTAFGNVLSATKLDASAPPVVIAGSVGNYYVTDTHVVWQAGQSVWSRPLTGATAAVRLGSAPGGGNISIVPSPRTFTVMRKTRYNGVFNEASLWVARTDGSVAPNATAAWTQVDANHPFSYALSNDTHAIVINYNFTAYPPGDSLATIWAHRIVLATNTATQLNSGFPSNYNYPYTPSPDGNYLYGYSEYNGSPYWGRGWILPVSSATASAPPNMAPDYGAPTSGYRYSDYPCGIVAWTSDSAGLVLQNCSYPGGPGSLGGDVRYWPVTAATSTAIAAINTYGSVQVLDKAAIYTDPSNHGLKVVSLSTSPNTYNLDVSGNYITNYWTRITPTSAYLVWGQAIGTGSGPAAKLFAAALPFPLASAPAPVQLGTGTLGSCQLEGALSNTTFYQLCTDTSTLTAYTQSNGTAAGTLVGVTPGLLPLPVADRLAFIKNDGSVFSSPNTGALSSSVLLTNKMDLGSQPVAVGTNVLFRDGVNQLTRVSKADGSVIDEPLFRCDALTSGAYYPFLDTSATHLWAPNVRCSSVDVHQMHAPVANLP